MSKEKQTIRKPSADELLGTRWQMFTYMMAEVRESIEALMEKSERQDKNNKLLLKENRKLKKLLEKNNIQYEEDKPEETIEEE